MYYEELAYAIIEAEKSHALPSASWRPSKAIGKTEPEPECEGLRSSWTRDVNPTT